MIRSLANKKALVTGGSPAVAFLVGPEAGFITGAKLAIDGGLSA
ncbi:hypothetical protein [Bradyrhizobium sp. B117]